MYRLNKKTLSIARVDTTTVLNTFSFMFRDPQQMYRIARYTMIHSPAFIYCGNRRELEALAELEKKCAGS